MLRHPVHARKSFAAERAAAEARRGPGRQTAATAAAIAVRLMVAPFAALSAAAAGLLFAVLLPICGIASIAEGLAKASWRFVRDTWAHLPHPPARRI